MEEKECKKHKNTLLKVIQCLTTNHSTSAINLIASVTCVITIARAKAILVKKSRLRIRP